MREDHLDLLVTSRETAQKLRVHDEFLRASRSKNSKIVLDLPYVRIGGAIRYRLSDIQAFLERHTEAGGAA